MGFKYFTVRNLRSSASVLSAAIPFQVRLLETDSTVCVSPSLRSHLLRGIGFLLLAACIASPLPAQTATGLSLHDVVQKALASPQVAVLDSEIAQVQAGIRQAGLGPNPKLYLSSEDIAPWSRTFDFANQTEDLGYIGQTIEIAGKRGKRVDLARARLDLSKADRTLKVNQLIGRVTLAYWTAVSQQRIVNLLNEDIHAVDEIVRYNKERLDAGAARGVDLLRMQIERDRLAITLETAMRDARQAKLDLFKQAGIESSDAALIDPLDAVREIQPADISVILEQRSDILAARAAVRAAEADLRLQRANAIPDPDFFGGYKRNTGDNTAYAGLQISLPFRNRNQGEVERARAAVTSAQAQLAALEQQTKTEVEQAYSGYTAQRDIVQKTVPDMRQRARVNLQTITEAYHLGGTDLLRLIDAQRTEFDVEVTAVRAMAQLQQAATQLLLAYGVQP